MQKSSSVRLVDAALLKEELKIALNKVPDVVEESKSVVMKARVNIEEELAVIEISIDQSFQAG